MSEEKVLATVAGVQITETDVDNYIANLPQEQKAYAKHPQFRSQVLNQLVTIQMFAQKGLEDKLDETDEFKKQMEDAKTSILAQMVMNRVISAITVTDEEAEEFYEANKAQFGQGESVSAKHILVDDEDLCKEIMSKIESGEKTFEDAAKEYSTCPSKAQGGDLGQFGRGQMVPEFDKAAFEAEVNALVGPVKTQFGWHLIRVYDKQEASVAPFEKIAGQVKNQLMQKKQQEAYGETVAALAKKYM